MNSKNLTTKQLLQMVEKKIKAGQIKVDEDFYEHGVGLSCQNYEFRFPNSWDNPQCYRIVIGSNGEQREDKEWDPPPKNQKKFKN